VGQGSAPRRVRDQISHKIEKVPATGNAYTVETYSGFEL